MKVLSTLRMERCIGCHSCSLACARLVHKQLSWDKAGIRIRSTGGLSTGFEAAYAQKIWEMAKPEESSSPRMDELKEDGYA